MLYQGKPMFHSGHLVPRSHRSVSESGRSRTPGFAVVGEAFALVEASGENVSRGDRPRFWTADETPIKMLLRTVVGF